MHLSFLMKIQEVPKSVFFTMKSQRSVFISPNLYMFLNNNEKIAQLETTKKYKIQNQQAAAVVHQIT